MLEGQEQCTCGVIFDDPMTSDPDFMPHVVNGTHAASLRIEICGPCFMGFCKGCEKDRRGPVQRWKCRCMHDYPLIFNESIVTVDHMRRTWSEWLVNGRQSSVSRGIDQVVDDDNWNPYKEIEL